MLPHISANGIELAKNILSFATALISFFALLKKPKIKVPAFFKKNAALVS